MSQPPAPPSISAASLRGLLTLAWPIVLARATQAVVGFTDALMVAPLGEAELAATTTGGLNVFTLMILPLGTVFIVQSFAAQLRGRGEVGRARRYAWYGLCVAALAGVLGLVATFAVPRYVTWFGFEPEVEAYAADYIAIRLLGLGAAVGVEALGNWYGGLGNTRVAMVVSLLIMVANVFGCYLLIEPRWGLPGYGVAGSAWASTAATWLGFFAIVVVFVRRIGAPRVQASAPSSQAPSSRAPSSQAPSSQALGHNFADCWRMLRFGIPTGLNWFLEFGAFVLFINVVVAKLGTTALAAFNVVMQINSISFMPAFGIGSAGAILVGETIGRRALDQVWPIVRLTLATACTWMASAGALYFLAPAALIGVFQPPGVTTTALVSVGATMLTLSAFWQVFDAINMTFSEALRAAGDTTWPMLARIVTAWLVFTPLAWSSVLVFDGGIVAVMVSVIGYIALLAVVLALRFASGRWRQIELVGAEPELV